MSGAYIPKKGRYDTVLSILKEQIDEYFKVDSDLDRITEITAWQYTRNNLIIKVETYRVKKSLIYI